MADSRRHASCHSPSEAPCQERCFCILIVDQMKGPNGLRFTCKSLRFSCNLLDAITADLATRISSKKLYRIESAQGPFWIGVTEAQPRWAGTITLGDQRNLPGDGLYWHMVER